MSNNVKGVSADGSIPKEKTTPDMSRIKIDKSFNTHIFLVRHGQSIGNEKREFLGHTNKDLSALGYEQAANEPYLEPVMNLQIGFTCIPKGVKPCSIAALLIVSVIKPLVIAISGNKILIQPITANRIQ